jgi:diketogulonate reductase-like aldo/keto reductase
MEISLASRFPLNDGRSMPVLGLGVWQVPAGSVARATVRAALDAGYRLIDTAKLYGNEPDVGRAVREGPVPQDEVFVTTKLWNTDHGYDAALGAGRESLTRLGLDAIDLYLIHWPEPRLRGESWEALVRLRDEGVCRSIGVSNYTVRHLEELRRDSSVVPAVNQVEFNPFLFQRDLLEYCTAHGIVLEAYSPLMKGRGLDHPVLVRIAKAHGCTPAQVVLRWAFQHRVVVIPKSVRPERIRENSEVFDFALSADDMRALDGLDTGRHTSWNPDAIP